MIDERSTNRVTPPRSTGICSSARRRPARSLPRDDPPHRLGEPLGAHRLEHVVDGVQVEGVDGVLLVGGHEDDGRRVPEPAQHLGELEPGQAGHVDVEEDRVDVVLAEPAEQPQRLGGGVAGEHVGHPLVAAEQEGELVEGRALVVHDEHAQAAHADTPGANLGTRTITLVPAPGAVSTTTP